MVLHVGVKGVSERSELTPCNIIIIQLACAYNVDDLYHTGRIDLPGMEKVVYIVYAYYTYTGYVCGY